MYVEGPRDNAQWHSTCLSSVRLSLITTTKKKKTGCILSYEGFSAKSMSPGCVCSHKWEDPQGLCLVGPMLDMGQSQVKGVGLFVSYYLEKPGKTREVVPHKNLSSWCSGQKEYSFLGYLTLCSLTALEFMLFPKLQGRQKTEKRKENHDVKSTFKNHYIFSAPIMKYLRKKSIHNSIKKNK